MNNPSNHISKLLRSLPVLMLLPIVCWAQPDRGKFDLSLYGIFAGMDGTLGAHGITADVDVPFSDIWSNLQFGAMGRATGRHGRWAFTVDTIYMGLGAAKNGVDVGVDQWMVEPVIEYEVRKWFDLYAGARYYNLNTSIRGPQGNTRSGVQEWWDPVLGAQWRVPLNKKMFLNLRGDFSAFGVGSIFSGQFEPMLNWRVAKRMSLQAGYRWIYVNYSNGVRRDLFVYDVMTQGPQLGFNFHF